LVCVVAAAVVIELTTFQKVVLQTTKDTPKKKKSGEHGRKKRQKKKKKFTGKKRKQEDSKNATNNNCIFLFSLFICLFTSSLPGGDWTVVFSSFAVRSLVVEVSMRGREAVRNAGAAITLVAVKASNKVAAPRRR
jgi:hypothetical protein